MWAKEPKKASTHVDDGAKILRCVSLLLPKRQVCSFFCYSSEKTSLSSRSLLFTSFYTMLSLYSSHPSTQCSLSSSCSQLSSVLTEADKSMTIIITSALRKWLTDHDLQGFIQVAEATPHPNALEMASKLNIDILTNSMVHRGTPV